MYIVWNKLSQPGTYADVLGKQAQVTNCENVSAISDNHNLQKKLDGIPEHESLDGKKRILSDG